MIGFVNTDAEINTLVCDNVAIGNTRNENLFERNGPSELCVFRFQCATACMLSMVIKTTILTRTGMVYDYL